MYFTYTGQQVCATSGAPSLEDIAWQLLHVCRYAGACRVNYSVGIHSMLVADFVAAKYPSLEFPALLHDGTEACIGDIPKPFKSEGMRRIEDVLMERIWEQFNIPKLMDEEYKIIKAADIRALCAEADLIGPPGLVADGINQGWYRHNSQDVNALKDYLSKYQVHAWGMREGDSAHWDFISRARRLIDYQRASNAVAKERTNYYENDKIDGFGN